METVHWKNTWHEAKVLRVEVLTQDHTATKKTPWILTPDFSMLAWPSFQKQLPIGY